MAERRSALENVMKMKGDLRNPRFLLIYSPLQFAPNEMAKPDGSLGLLYLAGALRHAGFEVKILDISVGNEKDDLKDTFFNPRPLKSGLLRVGMSHERILEEVRDYNIIGISSIFTPQSSMVLETIRLIKQEYPNKLVISGGANARYSCEKFFKAGADIICLSEAEETIVNIGNLLRQNIRDFRAMPGIAYYDGNKVIYNPQQHTIENLDFLPLPAWDLLPNDKYWQISRPHGGEFHKGNIIKYASMMTSRGCVFSCAYCHISKEKEHSSPAGGIGKLRTKSIDRVLLEFDILKSLGVEYIFIEDDSLLAKKQRIIKIFRALRDKKIHLADVNGVNIVHFFKNVNGRLVIDKELLESLVEVGFESMILPFETANQRILDKYASKKWKVNNVDTIALIKACTDISLKVSGNYMIGFPDETFDEISNTISFARSHIEAGLTYANFFCPIPYPGSVLHDIAIREGYLSPDFNPDDMKWTKSVMQNTVINNEELTEIRKNAWLTVNRPEYIRYKIDMNVTQNLP